MDFILEIVLFLIGGIAFLASHIILVRAALNEGIVIGYLFWFFPFFDWLFAVNQYKGKNKAIVLTCWFGGPILMLISVFVFILSGSFASIMQ